MNDDVKAAVEKLTTWLGEDGGLPVLRVVLAHIDGEAARTAAAVAAATQPLADRIAELEPIADGEAKRLLRMAGERNTWMDRAEKAEAERDALREEARAHAARCIQTDLIAVENERDAMKKTLAAELESSQALRRDVVSLTAQVEALMPLEAERDALRRELADLIPLAESAMRQANNDGGEYDIKAELADARRVAEANMQTAERASQSIDAVAAERDAMWVDVADLRSTCAMLRAQAEAARAEAAKWLCDMDPCCETDWCRRAQRVLAAMDGAKP